MDIEKEFHQLGSKLSEKNIVDYVFQRFEDIKKSKKIKELVAFQASNKYMIMAHDQIELKNLGNIVASYKKIPFSEILQNYEEHLRIAMSKPPTIKRHTNVILRVFGHMSKHISENEKVVFFEILEQFRESKITIGKTLLEIHNIVFHINNTYLANQTYFLLYSDLQSSSIFNELDKQENKIKWNHKNSQE